MYNLERMEIVVGSPAHEKPKSVLPDEFLKWMKYRAMTPYPSSREILSFELLENAGYKRYEQSIHQSDFFYQKCFRNEAGEKIYWLNIGVYDFTKYRSEAGIGYQCEFKMHVANSGYEPRYISITVHDFSSLTDLESYCATLFCALGGVPDPINN